MITGQFILYGHWPGPEGASLGRGQLREQRGALPRRLLQQRVPRHPVIHGHTQSQRAPVQFHLSFLELYRFQYNNAGLLQVLLIKACIYTQPSSYNLSLLCGVCSSLGQKTTPPSSYNGAM